MSTPAGGKSRRVFRMGADGRAACARIQDNAAELREMTVP